MIQGLRLTLSAVVTAATLLLPWCVVASEPAPAAADVQEMLASICRQHNVPSLNVAAVRRNETLTIQCTGLRKRGASEAVELWDLHPLGSCTKSMTATLAATLVEAGKIKWETTIGQVWPKAAEMPVHPKLRDVQLSELLSHQSGLASNLQDLKKDQQWLSFFKEEDTPPLERRRMLKLMLNLEPLYPRGEYHYSNLGYVVAAAMLEKKGIYSFETLMQRHVFQPLKMDTAEFRTLALAGKRKTPGLWGHQADGTPIDPRVAGAENPPVYAPCGTVHLSIADFARYAQWHLKAVPAPLLSEQKTLDYLHTGQVEDSSLGGKYGCGWIVLETELGRALTHGGSNTNSFALVWILPDCDFAAVACTNTGEDAGFQACDTAIRELMRRYARRGGEDSEKATN